MALTDGDDEPVVTDDEHVQPEDLRRWGLSRTQRLSLYAVLMVVGAFAVFAWTTARHNSDVITDLPTPSAGPPGPAGPRGSPGVAPTLTPSPGAPGRPGSTTVVVITQPPQGSSPPPRSPSPPSRTPTPTRSPTPTPSPTCTLHDPRDGHCLL